MNLYIIVEGSQTEMQLYPKWLSYELPQLSRVDDYRDVQENNYYLFSGGGIPSMYRHIANAMHDINACGTLYDYLVVFVDSEEVSVERREQKVMAAISDEGVNLEGKCKLKVIVQNRCIETWFLGNRKVYKRNPQGKLFQDYTTHYNVEQSDPELMQKYEGFKLTAHFHEAYLREMLKEYNIRYSKSRPKDTLLETYYQEIIKRVEDAPTHLQSFSTFRSFIAELKANI